MARRSRRTSKPKKSFRFRGLVLRLAAVGLHAGRGLRRLSRLDGDQRVRRPPLGHSGAGLCGAARAVCRPSIVGGGLWSPSSSGSVIARTRASRVRARTAWDSARMELATRGFSFAGDTEPEQLVSIAFVGGRIAALTRLARRLGGDRAAESDLDRQLVPVARRRPTHRRTRRHSAAPDRYAEGRRRPAVR